MEQSIWRDRRRLLVATSRQREPPGRGLEMLILARKVGQQIIIAGDIQITVVQIRGDQVRLGIAAPRSIAVHRKELLDQITAANNRPASPVQSDAQDTSDSLSVPTQEDEIPDLEAPIASAPGTAESSSPKRP